MSVIDQLYIDTDSYVKSLEGTYLAKYLADKTTSPTDYDMDVKSYCILCHAAFEEFAESVAMKVMDHTINKYVYDREIKLPLIYLLHFKSSGEKYLDKVEDDDKIELLSSFDYTRLRLDEIKTRFSKEIFNNHGVALKYMKQLFCPVGIDIPNDPVLLNSLKLLTKERGAYAHKFLEKGAVKRSIEPENARVIVDDCLKLCANIRDKANAFF